MNNHTGLHDVVLLIVALAVLIPLGVVTALGDVASEALTGMAGAIVGYFFGARRNGKA